MSIFNINNEKIVQKLKLLKVCAKDDFSSNCWNFLILDNCLNIASSCKDSTSLESLKANIKIYIKNILEHYDYSLKICSSIKDDLSKLDEIDQELYQYKLKEIAKNGEMYFSTYFQLLD